MGACRPAASAAKAALAVLAAAGLAIGAAAAGAQSPRSGSEVVRAELDEARQAAGLGDWENAATWLAEAASQDQGDADVQYLSALATVKRGKPLPEALGNLNSALASGRFTYYSAKDVGLLKAELLVRERRWQEALDALGRIGVDSGADPSYRLIRARAFAGKGDLRTFTAEISGAVARFPDAGAFARLYFQHAGKLPGSAAARALRDTLLGRLARYAQEDPELPVLAAPLMASIEDQRNAVQSYRAQGGSSPTSTLRALEYGLIDETAAASEFFAGSYPFTLADLSSLYALAGSPAGRDAVLGALKTWKGRLGVDADGDGIAESSIQLDQGLTAAWELDSRHEGRIDWRANFAEGLPIEVSIEKEGLSIDAVYSSYPQLASVVFTEGGEKRAYSFAPEALAFAPLSMRAFGGEGRSAVYLPYPSLIPAPSERACAMAALSLIVEGGTSRRLTILEKGIPQSAVTYRDGRVYSTMSYSKGLPLLEKIDADGDGRFESERSYAADGSWWLRTDLNGDGVFEYREQSAFPFRKEWDYDGDGSVDAIQYQQADGSTVQEFSSRLDGRLDERIVVKGGKIVSLSRNSVPLALLRDSNPSLTWIGAKSFDLGSNLPAGEGIFSSMAGRYRLTRVGDMAFAELIP
jgi:hypothetical protein